jgi:hypothetical protein
MGVRCVCGGEGVSDTVFTTHYPRQTMKNRPCR